MIQLGSSASRLGRGIGGFGSRNLVSALACGGPKQELWGVFLAYNLVRLEMQRVADNAGVEPTRISFVAALRLICDEWLWCAIATPGAIPKHLRNLRAALTTLILPPRRPKRSYPRAVKIKMSNYARKRRKGSK